MSFLHEECPAYHNPSNDEHFDTATVGIVVGRENGACENGQREKGQKKRAKKRGRIFFVFRGFFVFPVCECIFCFSTSRRAEFFFSFFFFKISLFIASKMEKRKKRKWKNKNCKSPAVGKLTVFTMSVICFCFGLFQSCCFVPFGSVLLSCVVFWYPKHNLLTPVLLYLAYSPLIPANSASLISLFQLNILFCYNTDYFNVFVLIASNINTHIIFY